MTRKTSWDEWPPKPRLFLRIEEAIARNRMVFRLYRSTWRQSVREARDDLLHAMRFGYEDWRQVERICPDSSSVETTWIHVATRPGPQLSAPGLAIAARLEVIGSYLSSVIDEIRFIFTGNLPSWVVDESITRDERILLYAR